MTDTQTGPPSIKSSSVAAAGVTSATIAPARFLANDQEPEFGPVPPGEVRRIALDNGLAEQELGWKPWTHLEDGLGETVAYLKGV